MSSSEIARRSVIMAMALGLGGCGFHPLYAPRGPQDWDPELAAIEVTPMHDRSGQILTLALRESLNPGGERVPARWRLDTGLSISRAGLGIQRNATTVAVEVNASATYTLTDLKTNKTVYSGSSRANSDYDQLLDAYATHVADDDAQDRALNQIADEMALRLAVFVRQQRSRAAAP